MGVVVFVGVVQGGVLFELVGVIGPVDAPGRWRWLVLGRVRGGGLSETVSLRDGALEKVRVAAARVGGGQRSRVLLLLVCEQLRVAVL